MDLRPLVASDLEALWELDHDSFHTSAENRDRFLRWTEPGDFLGLFDGARLVAAAGAYPMAQFFGGRSVPMGGGSAVAVVPDQRGTGCGKWIMRALIDFMRERGDVISSLYPAATAFYRDLGWELGGCHLWRTLEADRLLGLARPAAGRLRPAGEDDMPALRACYERHAWGVPGFVDRSDRRWAYFAENWKSRSVVIAEDANGGVDGYVVYRQLDGEWTGVGGDFQLAVTELVSNTRDAALALWRMLGSWSSQADRVIYHAAAEDPLLLLLPNQDSSVLAGVRWMTRVLDPIGAVEARGFAPGLEVEAHLHLDDPEIAGSSGDFVLQVSKGRGRLERGGEGRVRFDVGAFSSLYTGWATTSRLEGAGRVDGGSPDERAALDAAFAGPTPWMFDEF